jgi:hypothetical protein
MKRSFFIGLGIWAAGIGRAAAVAETPPSKAPHFNALILDNFRLAFMVQRFEIKLLAMVMRVFAMVMKRK